MAGFAEERFQSDHELSQSSLYEWFDSLGYAEIVSGKFVEVDRRIVDSQGETSDRLIDFGFLKGTKNGRFTVTNLSLWSNTYDIGVQRNRGNYAIYKSADLGAFAAKRLALFQKQPYPGIFLPPSFGFSMVDTAFILSRACEARGLHDSESQLYDWLASVPVDGSRKRSELEAVSKALKSRFGQFELFRIFASFHDVTVSRPEILSRMRSFSKRFPDFASYGANEARLAQFTNGSIEILEQMIKEDSEHAKRPVKNPDQLPVDEQVSELTYRLRDESGCEDMSQMLGFGLGLTDPKSTVSKLVAIGYPAVPKLLAMLDDRGFSRSTTSLQSNLMDATGLILRKGEIAAQTICQIARCTFNRRPDYRGSAAENDNAFDIGMTAWWQKAQRLGEKRMLIDGIDRGGTDAVAMARRLVAAYPSDALAPIVSAIGAVKESWIRAELVSTLIPLKAPGVIDFMRDQMLHGHEIDSRRYGAMVVTKSDPEAAFAALLDMWRQAISSPAETFRSGAGDMLLEAMIASGRPAAIGAIAVSFESLSDSAKRQVISRFAWPMGLYNHRDQVIGGPPKHSDRSAFDGAVESFLAQVLEETKATDRNFRFDASRSSEVLPLCDYAAAALSHFFPKKYTFDFNGTSGDRTRDWTICVNKWRRQNNQSVLPALPIPGTDTGANPVTATRSVACIDIQGSAPSARDLVSRAMELKGRELTGATVLSLLDKITNSWDPEMKRVAFRFERDRGGSGVVLTVFINPPGTDEGATDWRFSVSMTVNGTGIAGESGSTADAVGLNAQLSYLEDLIDQALSSPPKQSYEISLSFLHGV